MIVDGDEVQTKGRKTPSVFVYMQLAEILISVNSDSGRVSCIFCLA